MWNRLTSGARTVLAAVVVLLLLGAAMFFVVRRIQEIGRASCRERVYRFV